MSRDAITEIEQARQKKQIEQTLEEASWDIPRLLKINARLVKEKHAQAEQIAEAEKLTEEVIFDMTADIHKLQAENQRLKELIKVAICPECDGDGQYWDANSTDQEPTAVQCQWCDETKDIKAAQPQGGE